MFLDEKVRLMIHFEIKKICDDLEKSLNKGTIDPLDILEKLPSEIKRVANKNITEILQKDKFRRTKSKSQVVWKGDKTK